LNNRAISGTTSTKYLGIIINQKLNWNQHCDYICSKANGTLGLLRRVLCDCNRDAKSRAYTTLVRPKLEYASSTWNPRTKRNINQIEMVQHRAARFVVHDYSRFSHVSPMIKQLGWDTLELWIGPLAFQIFSPIVISNLIVIYINFHSIQDRS